MKFSLLTLLFKLFSKTNHEPPMGGAETMNSQPTFNQPTVRMAAKMASYEIEEIELDRSHVVSFRQEQEAQISVSDILIYLTTLIEQSDIKSVSKIQ